MSTFTKTEMKQLHRVQEAEIIGESLVAANKTLDRLKQNNVIYAILKSDGKPGFSFTFPGHIRYCYQCSKEYKDE